MRILSITPKNTLQKSTFPLDFEDYCYYYQSRINSPSLQILEFFPSYNFIANFMKRKNASISIIHPNKSKFEELTIKTSAYLDHFCESIPQEFEKSNTKLQIKQAYWKFYTLAFLNFISHFFLYIFPNYGFFHLYITQFQITRYSLMADKSLEALDHSLCKFNTLDSKEFVYPNTKKYTNLLSESYTPTSPIPYFSAYSILTATPKDRERLEKLFSQLLNSPNSETSKTNTNLEKNSGKQGATQLEFPQDSFTHPTNFVEITISLKKIPQSYFQASFIFPSRPKDIEYLSQDPFYKNLHEILPQSISKKQDNKEIYRSQFTQRLILYSDIFEYLIKVYPISPTLYERLKIFHIEHKNQVN